MPSKPGTIAQIIGLRFGQLTVLAYGGRRMERRKHQWLCRCDCGTLHVAVGEDLKTGKTSSCGCATRKYPEMQAFLDAHRGQDGCWEYPRTAGQRYGSCAGRRAHRAAYMIASGVDPGDLQVCHSCDNPPCCNPAHLFLGSAKENYEDSRSKDRHSRGERGRHKLTTDQILKIRADRRSLKEIAADFGIHPVYVSEIRHLRTWRHI